MAIPEDKNNWPRGKKTHAKPVPYLKARTWAQVQDFSFKLPSLECSFPILSDTHFESSSLLEKAHLKLYSYKKAVHFENDPII